VIAAADDPMIPAALFEHIVWPSNIRFHMAAGGGHLGFIGRRGKDPDCRWMDWRVVEWITALGQI
jgi:predicted alpha/beta-fold hydrolase